MKKLHLLLLGLTICLFSACHDKLWDAIDGLDARVAKLEELCKEMNTNIVSIQTIVNVQQSGDYITGIVEVKKDGKVIGYTITFGKHEPITIYNGEDGSATAPIIGVAQDTDGVYYWTLNGVWLVDDNGNKLPVSGKDGQTGANGSMPQLKIEEGYWYVSYDNGTTWTELGKAIGENGEKGDKGDTGDSMFQSVTQDENFVYFTLADGTVIKIAKGNGNSQSNDDFIFTITYDPNGGEGVMKVDTFYYGVENQLSSCYHLIKKAGFTFVDWNSKADGTGAVYKDNQVLTIDRNITLYAQWKKNELGVFSISSTEKVKFSAGNLLYQASTNTWRFANNQYDILAESNNNISKTYDGWIDLFGWGTGSNPTNSSDSDDKYTSFHDWGINEIGGDSANTWRTLTQQEWYYLINRTNLYGIAQVNGIDGLILLPDDWTSPEGIVFKSRYDTTGELGYEYQTFTIQQWLKMEENGAVFLPASGQRSGKKWNMYANQWYWSSSRYMNYTGAWFLTFSSKSVSTNKYSNGMSYGCPVRLVKDL